MKTFITGQKNGRLDTFSLTPFVNVLEDGKNKS